MNSNNEDQLCVSIHMHIYVLYGIYNFKNLDSQGYTYVVCWCSFLSEMLYTSYRNLFLVKNMCVGKC